MTARTLANISLRRRRWLEFIFDAVIALLAIGCLAGLWRILAVLPLRVPLDPNEGWNAYHAAAAIAGRGPYPAASSFMTNNYPPLSFYFVGFLGSVLGDNVIAGRITSLVSFLTAASAIAIAARVFCCSRIEALFASLLFASFLLLCSDYVGMNDPQMLGHALQLCAFLVLLFRRRSPAGELGSAALFVIALFIKHNLVALPFATVVWLALDDWRQAGRLAIFMLAMGLAGLVSCKVLFGVDLLALLNSARSYSFSLFLENFGDWLLLAVPALAATLAIATCREPPAVFCAIYAAVSVVVGGALLGGAGVDTNAMFDADIAIALGSGVALSRIGDVSKARFDFMRPVLAIALAIPFAFVLMLDPDWMDRDFWLHPMRDEAALAADDIAYLHSRSGPAICAMLSLCYWANKSPTVDIFNLNQQFLTRARDPRAFVRQLNGHSYAAIQLDSIAPSPFPDNVEAALLRNYRVDRTNDDGVFLIPKTVKKGIGQ